MVVFKGIQRPGSNAASDDKTFEDHYFQISFVQSEPPDHTLFRRLIAKAFTPRVVESMRPRTWEIMNELLESVLQTGWTS